MTTGALFKADYVSSLGGGVMSAHHQMTSHMQPESIFRLFERTGSVFMEPPQPQPQPQPHTKCLTFETESNHAPTGSPQRRREAVNPLHRVICGKQLN